MGLIKPIKPTPEQQAKAIEKQKRLMRLEVNEKYRKLLLAKSDEFAPAPERETWQQQLNEAMAYLSAAASKKADVFTPMIDTLIVSRGLEETKEELAQKILANATTYGQAIAEILGAKKQELTAIDQYKG